jgi:hypothetical protein
MRVYLLALLLVLTSCASMEVANKPIIAEEDDNMLVSTVSDTFDGIIDTIQTPFRDLGLISEDIPEKLLEAAKDPYAKPKATTCKALIKEIAELDELLGTDQYIITSLNAGDKTESSYLAAGAKMASSMAIGKVGAQVSIIPMRSIVRKVSGAEKTEKESGKAYQAGELRRAYLRGLASTKGKKCKINSNLVPENKPKPAKKFSLKV